MFAPLLSLLGFPRILDSINVTDGSLVLGQISQLCCGFFSFFLPACLHLVDAPVYVPQQNTLPSFLWERGCEAVIEETPSCPPPQAVLGFICPEYAPVDISIWMFVIPNRF